MFYVYFLQSTKDGYLYIGRTNNIERRLMEHNSDLVSSTKHRRPVIILGYETCESEAQSIFLEKEWKKGYKREGLRWRFKI